MRFSISALVGLLKYSIYFKVLSRTAKGRHMVCNDILFVKRYRPKLTFISSFTCNSDDCSCGYNPAEGTNQASEALADFADFTTLSPNSRTTLKMAFLSSIEGRR